MESNQITHNRLKSVSNLQEGEADKEKKRKQKRFGMPKQVKGGKPLAGKKRALEEKMVVGRMVTRSVTKAKKVGNQDKYISRDEALLYKKFQEWAQKHQKYYKTSDEKKKRFEIWRSCKEWCDANTSHEPGGVKYGLNSRSDLTPTERGQLRSAGKKPPVDDAQKSSLEKRVSGNRSLEKR